MGHPERSKFLTLRFENVEAEMCNAVYLSVCFQVFGIVCMACASPASQPGTHWFLFVAVVSFIATIIWIFIYFLSVREALKLPINWILTVTHSV